MRRRKLFHPDEAVDHPYFAPPGGESLMLGVLRMFLTRPAFWLKGGQSWSQIELAKSLNCSFQHISRCVKKLILSGFLIEVNSRYQPGKKSKTYGPGPNAVRVLAFLLSHIKGGDPVMQEFISITQKNPIEVKIPPITLSTLAQVHRVPIQDFISSIPVSEKRPYRISGRTDVPRGWQKVQVSRVEKGVSTLMGLRNRVVVKIIDGEFKGRYAAFYVQMNDDAGPKTKTFRLFKICGVNSIDHVLGKVFWGWIDLRGRTKVVVRFSDALGEEKPLEFKPNLSIEENKPLDFVEEKKPSNTACKNPSTFGSLNEKSNQRTWVKFFDESGERRNLNTLIYELKVTNHEKVDSINF